MTTELVQIPSSDQVPPEANQFLQWLNSAYEAALNGLPNFDGAYTYSETTRGTPSERISNVIWWSTAAAGAVGAVTSIGGLITLPVSLPANLVGTFFVQIRMVQAIAILAGKDPRDDRVRTMALLACLGMSVTDVLKGIGVSVARALADQFLKDVVAQALAKAVVRGVIARTAKKSILSSFYRVVPVLSAVIGGSIDAGATYTIGSTARSLFLPDEAQGSEVQAQVP